MLILSPCRGMMNADSSLSMADTYVRVRRCMKNCRHIALVRILKGDDERTQQLVDGRHLCACGKVHERLLTNRFVTHKAQRMQTAAYQWKTLCGCWKVHERLLTSLPLWPHRIPGRLKTATENSPQPVSLWPSGFQAFLKTRKLTPASASMAAHDSRHFNNSNRKLTSVSASMAHRVPCLLKNTEISPHIEFQAF